jgi:aryl-alcohol dehydrogenase-like predicted oxidoreductase
MILISSLFYYLYRRTDFPGYNRKRNKTCENSCLIFASILEQTTEIVKTALELGINHFDVAESHAGKKKKKKVALRVRSTQFIHCNVGGQAEIDLGLALHNQKGLRRSDFVISTKVFWGGKGPNDRGLSRKHVFEGTVACLQRLQLDYVDVLYAQRPGKFNPMKSIQY